MELQDQRIKDLEASLEAALLEKQLHEDEETKLHIAYDELSKKFKERYGKIEKLTG